MRPLFPARVFRLVHGGAEFDVEVEQLACWAYSVRTFRMICPASAVVPLAISTTRPFPSSKGRASSVMNGGTPRSASLRFSAW